MLFDLGEGLSVRSRSRCLGRRLRFRFKASCVSIVHEEIQTKAGVAREVVAEVGAGGECGIPESDFQAGVLVFGCEDDWVGVDADVAVVDEEAGEEAEGDLECDAEEEDFEDVGAVHLLNDGILADGVGVGRREAKTQAWVEADGVFCGWKTVNRRPSARWFRYRCWCRRRGVFGGVR